MSDEEITDNSSGLRPMGDGATRFPTTQWSIVLDARTPASPGVDAALENLCGMYWCPLYIFVRRRGFSPHDAQDITQAFFARMLEKDILNSVGPEKGKFRSFLLACMNHFLSHERERSRSLKRGGRAKLIPLDGPAAEVHYASGLTATLSAEAAYEKQWAITVLERAFARLRHEFVAGGKANLFDSLKPFLTEQSDSQDYSDLARQLSMTPNAVGVAIHRLRRKLRQSVREEIADTVADPAEIDDEMRHLFTILTR